MEKEITGNPLSLDQWWKYLESKRDSPVKERFVAYERVLRALPNSYKVWYAYLSERIDMINNQNLPITHLDYNSLNSTFERALITMNKMPSIWLLYLQFLTQQRQLLTKTCLLTFDRALSALPTPQHHLIWPSYLQFIAQEDTGGVTCQTCLEVHSRYLIFNPAHIVTFIQYLFDSQLWHEAARTFAHSLESNNDPADADTSKHKLLHQLQYLLSHHAKLTDDYGMNIGHLHTLWLSLTKIYEIHADVSTVRLIFSKAVQMNYTHLDHLASLWSEWVNLEVKQENTGKALELMRCATTEPALEVRQKFASLGYEPLQMRLHKSLRLWVCYLGMEESLGTLESARIAYERMLDYKIAGPQSLIRYALLLERHKLFDEAIEVYERGLKMFDYPRLTNIWTSYIAQYFRMYGKIKLEGVRELFDRAREMTPAEFAEPLYRHYAELEKDLCLAKCEKLKKNLGLAKCAMKLNDQAANFVPGDDEKMSLYKNCMSWAAKIFGVPKMREIYELTKQSGGLPDKDVQLMCMNYADLENNLGEIDKARAMYTFASQFADPQYDTDFWSKWLEFEARHGNPSTFQEMLQNSHTDDKIDIAQKDIPSKLKVVKTNKDKH